MSTVSDLERNFLLYVLGNISADAVEGDTDAFEGLADPFWIEVITSLDRHAMNYEAYVSRIVRLRDDYRRCDHAGRCEHDNLVRAMRAAASVPDGEGGKARRLYRRRRDLPGLLANRTG